ncbi:hypothetical protein [Pedobacter sp. Hv1]|uniref:hypothetical protein n=1 Tax=Pedobacter sp. Hv1 TaxID=1740090 RepID=UPI0006D8D38F|nr:hypothetical protein [Pedobacter sp. Hv1]KQC00596.1 hypothetical protein AQF98_07870 [Pedobacter sp. Hv1]
MKNLKNSVALFILFLGMTLAFTLSAFKVKHNTPKYQYIINSTAAVDIKDIDNWRLVDDESPDCGLAGTLVCQYAFNGDINEFQDFLELPSTTAVMINNNAVTTKL